MAAPVRQILLAQSQRRRAMGLDFRRPVAIQNLFASLTPPNRSARWGSGV
jgi:hypothetical protein